ncbi:PucR family transcriptional regulator [Nesterenkonia muleiensis]|uniref:PucR family transcriptional regulator n=1 Tax=Nesterenkonia muleiensis TaxID=2282648 RepID=UPI000E75A411|nr:PucR family transcriptional regulator [Nesterenkonia muleiensis]
MAQILIEKLLQQASRLGITPIAGPLRGVPVSGVEIAEIGQLNTLSPGTLVVADLKEPPPSYRLDIAVRQASARRLGGLVLPADMSLSMTSQDLAERGGVPILCAPGVTPSDLAVAVDRMVGAGAADTVTRVQFAVSRAREAALNEPEEPVEVILAAAGQALGAAVELQEDPAVRWSEPAAVFIGEVPRGRLVCRAPAEDPVADAAHLALPVIASVLSRALQRQVEHRFAPKQSSAELIAQLVLADSSRVETLAAQAYGLGFPVQHSHVVGWIKPTAREDGSGRPPRALQSAVELYALELFESRAELWHIAFSRDDAILVSTERPGSGDHQRRLREVAADIADYAQTLAGEDWDVTVGLGTPQTGAAGLRQSGTEAHIAVETAVAGGRAGHIQVTDVTGLRRVLLDFYASPTSRELLQDMLRPLDAPGRAKADTAVRTLLAYLSNRGSPAKAAAELNLHPNAVSYRIRNIEDKLQLDLRDADTQFALQLACRVRLLS